jgi:hypothetical protein
LTDHICSQITQNENVVERKSLWWLTHPNTVNTIHQESGCSTRLIIPASLPICYWSALLPPLQASGDPLLRFLL